jgi:hypothetical protein
MRIHGKMLIVALAGTVSLGGGVAGAHSSGALPQPRVPPPGHEPTVLQVPQQYSTIQSAVNASFDGDTVSVSPGTYAESVLIVNRVNLTIQGVVPQAAVVDGGTSLPAFAVSGGFGVTIDCFTVSSGLDAVRLSSATATISNVVVASAGGDGISVLNPGQVTLVADEVKRAGGSGIEVRGSAGGAGGTVSIAGNSISFAMESGIHVEDMSQAVVTGNQIFRVHDFGVLVENSGLVRVEGNVIGDPGTDAVSVDRCTQTCSVKDNTISDAGMASVRVSGAPLAVVTGNQIQGGYDSAIVIGGPDAVVSSNTIRDSAGAGIVVVEVASVYGSLPVGAYGDEVISDNVIERSAGNGIVVTNGIGITLSGNSITDAGLSGIKVSGSELVVSANRIENAAIDGIALTDPIGTTDLRVTSNSVTAPGRNGVSLGAATGVLVAGNTVSGAAGCGFALGDGASRNVFKQDVAQDCGTWDLFEPDTAGKNKFAKSNRFAKSHRRHGRAGR